MSKPLIIPCYDQFWDLHPFTFWWFTVQVHLHFPYCYKRPSLPSQSQLSQLHIPFLSVLFKFFFISTRLDLFDLCLLLSRLIKFFIVHSYRSYVLSVLLLFLPFLFKTVDLVNIGSTFVIKSFSLTIVFPFTYRLIYLYFFLSVTYIWWKTLKTYSSSFSINKTSIGEVKKKQRYRHSEVAEIVMIILLMTGDPYFLCFFFFLLCYNRQCYCC